MMAKKKLNHHSNIMKRICSDLQGFGWDEMNELADETGLSVTCLYWWKVGITQAPQLDNVCLVAEALGYEITMEIA
tara:strand:- start:99 stop:326 length:228 start_codon:yes stop_codon:yes gene_type:complete